MKLCGAVDCGSYRWIVNNLAVVNAFQAKLNADAMFVLRCIGIPLIPLKAVLD
jgi:hypothetical protein